MFATAWLRLTSVPSRAPRGLERHDAGLVLREPDLSALPQVAAALAEQTSKEPVEGKAVDAAGSGASVVSVHASVPNVGCHVFVELPVSEARAPLWSALIRVGWMLGLALVAALMASLIASRRVMPARAAPASS